MIPNIEYIIEPNIEHNIEPNIEPNIGPKIEPNIEPYNESNIKPNIDLNMEPNTEPHIEPNRILNQTRRKFYQQFLDQILFYLNIFGNLINLVLATYRKGQMGTHLVA